MSDRDFLIWLHERLVNVHGESPLYDYMHRLRSIVVSMPKSKKTPNTTGGNSIRDLMELLATKN